MVVVMAFFPAAATSIALAEGSDTVTPAEALRSVEGTLPSIVAPSTPTSTAHQGEVDPTLTSDGDRFLSEGTLGHVAISKDLGAGVAMRVNESPTAPGLLLAPENVGTRVDAPIVVHGDSVLYANSAPATDTVVRPTAGGIESFTQLRGPSAPDSFSYRISLPGQDIQLKPVSNQMVAVTVPASLEKPATDPIRDDSLTNDGSAAFDQPPAPVDTAVDKSPLNPTGDPPSDVAGHDPKPVAAPGVAADAAHQLEDSMGRQEQAQIALPHDDVLAVISAPWARDANGAPVSTTLRVADGVVRMDVDHREPSVAYPVVADPQAEAAGARRCSAHANVIRSGATDKRGGIFVETSGSIRCDYVRGAARATYMRVAIDGHIYHRPNFHEFNTHFVFGQNRVDGSVKRFFSNNVRYGCVPFGFHGEVAGEYINQAGREVRVPPDHSPNNVSGYQCRF